MKKFRKDKLIVEIFENREIMGERAAHDVSKTFCKLLAEKDEINVIFAAAPSQNDVLAALVADKKIDWARINAYHMDEYVGLGQDAPQAFGNYLRCRLFEKVGFKSVHYISRNGQAEEAAESYAALLKDIDVDVVVLGIGENGHVAFNDPHVADFNDTKLVKVVELDNICRRQQVDDNCFPSLSEVPTHAVTLTVPALMRGRYLFCVVPCKTKAEAVRRTLSGEITEACPATILRTHDNSVLYLDAASASLL